MMRSFLALALVSALAPSLIATSARAQTAEDGWAPPTTDSRPTSGEPSMFSGRTLGTGQTMIAAALGWPGFWAQLELAPDSTLNIGIRASVLYGSPVMGLVAGAAGELAVPVRLHLYGDHDVDVALRIAPQIAVGEGRAFGEQLADIRASRLGLSTRLDAGLRIGLRVAERVTLFGGFTVGAGVSWVDSERARAIGLFTGVIGIEALMSTNTMLFVEAEGGGGIADTDLRGGVTPYYPQQEIFRLSLGIAYLL